MNINYIDFSNTTRFHDDGDVPYITFRKFDGLDFIKHGFSTRLGGVSKGIYESMDLTFTRGDDPDAVRENFRLIGYRWFCNEHTRSSACDNLRRLRPDISGGSG